AEGAGLRIDHGLLTGVGRGLRIGSDYDPMVAKVIAHGATREQARRRLLLGLRDTALLGPISNKRFLLDLLRHPGFIAGEVTTSWVESEPSAAALGRDPSENGGEIDDEHVATAALLWIEALRDGGHGRSGFAPAWHSAGAGASVLSLRVQDQVISVELRPEGGAAGPVRWQARVRREGGKPGPALSLRLLDHDAVRVRVDCDGRQHGGFHAWTAAGELQLELGERRLSFAEHRPHEGGGGEDSDGLDGVIRAPTMGKVLAVAVAVEQQVAVGQRLLTLEAMKIESAILSPVTGVVRELRIAVGEQVDNRQVLVVIEPAEGAPQ
ncbi:MAG: carbamoyl-phosphate synthase subunit L, partial [Myxococcales bacterium]|nr:carbamoyl-phosphate synthase subunit L [Myxococcales bacterium]